MTSELQKRLIELKKIHEGLWQRKPVVNDKVLEFLVRIHSSEEAIVSLSYSDVGWQAYNKICELIDNLYQLGFDQSAKQRLGKDHHYSNAYLRVLDCVEEAIAYSYMALHSLASSMIPLTYVSLRVVLESITKAFLSYILCNEHESVYRAVERLCFRRKVELIFFAEKVGESLKEQGLEPEELVEMYHNLSDYAHSKGVLERIVSRVYLFMEKRLQITSSVAVIPAWIAVPPPHSGYLPEEEVELERVYVYASKLVSMVYALRKVFEGSSS